MYKCLLELIKRRSKVQEKNIPFEHALNFDQWKTFLENYEQGGLNKKEIKLNLCNIFSIFIFN